MDHNSGAQGELSFDTYRESIRIKHILGGICKPTTLGKIQGLASVYVLDYVRSKRVESRRKMPNALSVARRSMIRLKTASFKSWCRKRNKVLFESID